MEIVELEEEGTLMVARKGHERLEDCICEWLASPIRVEEEGEEISPHHNRYLRSTQYTRQITHVINHECTVHGWLLATPSFFNIPKISSLAVTDVPLAMKEEPKTREQLVSFGGRVTRTEVPVEIQAVLTGITLEQYNERETTHFFTPLDPPRGEGHCRSCHHICEHEAPHSPCPEPTCGHWMGCPSC